MSDSETTPAAPAGARPPQEEDIGFRLTNPTPSGPYGTYYWVCCEPFYAIRNGHHCPSCKREFAAAQQLVGGHVKDHQAFADGLLAPQIRKLEAAVLALQARAREQESYPALRHDLRVARTALEHAEADRSRLLREQEELQDKLAEIGDHAAVERAFMKAAEDRARLLAGLQQFRTKWAARADHGFDPEEAWETTSYWRGVAHILRELDALLAEAGPHD